MELTDELTVTELCELLDDSSGAALDTGVLLTFCVLDAGTSGVPVQALNTIAEPSSIAERCQGRASGFACRANAKMPAAWAAAGFLECFIRFIA